MSSVTIVPLILLQSIFTQCLLISVNHFLFLPPFLLSSKDTEETMLQYKCQYPLSTGCSGSVSVCRLPPSRNVLSNLSNQRTWKENAEEMATCLLCSVLQKYKLKERSRPFIDRGTGFKIPKGSNHKSNNGLLRLVRRRSLLVIHFTIPFPLL